MPAPSSDPDARSRRRAGRRRGSTRRRPPGVRRTSSEDARRSRKRHTLVKACVVIPTLNARELLPRTLESLAAQTVPATSSSSTTRRRTAPRRWSPSASPTCGSCATSGTSASAARSTAASLELGGADVVVLVNNDVVCEPEFVERMLEPFADARRRDGRGRARCRRSAPELVDSAGIELDTHARLVGHTSGTSPSPRSTAAPAPVGPCGGAAAYRAEAFAELGGFDEALFAYWEDVDLALRLRLAGWGCVRAAGARALHEHGQTLGAASPAAAAAGGVRPRLRAREVPRRAARLAARLKIAALDWPVLARAPAAPARGRGRSARGSAAPARGPSRRPPAPPLELATASAS